MTDSTRRFTDEYPREVRNTWTDDEVRRGHSAYGKGYRDTLVIARESEYQFRTRRGWKLREEPAAQLARPWDAVSPGRMVDVLWRGKWLLATVTSVRGDRVDAMTVHGRPPLVFKNVPSRWWRRVETLANVSSLR